MFGNESEAAIVKVMRMREQLRPYVMAQYEAASIDGTPIMRPLFFDFHTDAASQTVDDQQMYVKFRQHFLSFGPFELDAWGHTQAQGAALSCLRLRNWPMSC